MGAPRARLDSRAGPFEQRGPAHASTQHLKCESRSVDAPKCELQPRKALWDYDDGEAIAPNQSLRYAVQIAVDSMR
jgi:hypothetical protein